MKPFLIKKKDSITDEMVAEVFDKAVAAGAKLEDMVDGIQCAKDYGNRPAHWDFFGVGYLNPNGPFFTCFTDCPSEEIITIDKVDEWLQADDEGDTLSLGGVVSSVLHPQQVNSYDMPDLLIPGVEVFKYKPIIPTAPKFVSHTRRGSLTPVSRKCGHKYIWTKR